ncbi:MAG: hypothetical protein JXR77_11620 [Lentisphaeria bacterium]|nr:hypothetical protein [Lentisphaeria bacterium]
MLAALGLGPEAAEAVDEAQIPDLIRRHGWSDARLRQGLLGEHQPLSLVFGTLRFDDRPAIRPVLDACPPGTSSRLVGDLLGYGGRGLAREQYTSRRGVCRARVQFDTIYGCPHGCRYCPGGKVAVVATNLEEFLHRQVIPAAEAEPWQKVFMFNSALSDTLCFEPEYGLSRLLVEYYASTADQCYLIHTKSDNVGFLLDLDHRGHTIVLWSLTGDAACERVEPGTPSAWERVEAARRCQEAGYPIRFKLKPIVPVRGWRQEYRDLIGRLLSRTRPESIGLFLLAWMDADELEGCIDPDLLDPAFLEALRDHAEEMKGVTAGPFPHAARAEVYGFLIDEIRRHDRDVPVFLCTETVEMWREFAPRLGVGPQDYVCGCGPQCRPGLRRLDEVLVPTEMRAAPAAI